MPDREALRQRATRARAKAQGAKHPIVADKYLRLAVRLDTAAAELAHAEKLSADIARYERQPGGGGDAGPA